MRCAVVIDRTSKHLTFRKEMPVSYIRAETRLLSTTAVGEYIIGPN